MRQDASVRPWRLECPPLVERWRYRVAEVELVSALELSPWPPVGASDQHPGRSPVTPLERDAPSSPIWSGPGWLGGVWRPVAGRRREDGFELRVEGLGRCLVLDDERRIVLLGDADEIARARELAVEVVLGPALLLALASDGTFAWHASATEVDGRVVGFVGESGAGKSTLARGAVGDAAWQRIADDVLPFAESPAGGLSALPAFPQLKLAAAEQYPIDRPARLDLRALFLLAPRATAGDATVECERLPLRDATLALIRHTVASKLFDRALLERHIATSAEAAGRVPIYRLRYPFDLAQLPRVGAAVRRALGS